MHTAQKLARAVKAIDQIGGEYQVVTAEQRFEVAGIALKEIHLVPYLIQPQIGQHARLIADQFTFLSEGVAQHTLLCHLRAHSDKTSREIDTGDMLEMACQLESRASRRTAQI